ncbi:Zinc knuckle CX2CX4HX4C [Arabidopsis thaliana x Arabidopsis arenosa]|uniref:Zinc knuckle CX2CX4HX4C n=1 Tax=Arabidopsis thaliana x Arabidopsis arenosa TaxID=1240361 RepID=A0A8T2B1Y8_9BRAS|nr:Zinc knuckle CX2CX4HX4C [Arabidopsis thaliana x Arabidopsis arenosa]
MAEELWDEIQNLALGRNDPELFIPHEAYAEVADRNRLSLIARPLNPRAQNLFSVISSLPRVWGLTANVHGRVLDGTFVQFLFQSELDLISVQRREPWLFNNWFIVNQRWEIFPDVDFLTTIDLWVQIRGIPLPYVCVETVNEIAQDLGQIVHIDFHEASTIQIAYIRVRIRFGITDSLRFFQRIRFDSGETAIIRFQYERLRRICSRCLRFTHHRTHCPYMVPVQEPRQEVRNQAFERRDRMVFQDELHRSEMNSQSQMTDNSFPAPITPPPRVATPPLNLEELVAARPHLFTPRVTTPQNVLTPVHQGAFQRQHDSTGSNPTPPITNEVTSRFSRLVEVGESSQGPEARDGVKRTNKEVGLQEIDQRKQKQKGNEHIFGGILKPPKKR